MNGKKFLASCLTATALSTLGNGVFATQKNEYQDSLLQDNNNYTCNFNYKKFSIFSGYTTYNAEINIDIKSNSMLLTVTNSKTGEIIRKKTLEILTWKLEGSSELKIQAKTTNSEYPIVDAAYFDTKTLEMSFNLNIAKQSEMYQNDWLDEVICKNDN